MRRKPTPQPRPVDDGTVECHRDETPGWRTVRVVKKRKRAKRDSGPAVQAPSPQGPDRSLQKLWRYVLKLIGITERR